MQGPLQPPMSGVPQEPDLSKDKAKFQVKYAHPENVGALTTFVGKLVLGYFFFLFLNLIQGLTTEVCVIETNGAVATTPSHCELQVVGKAGSYPNYWENLGMSVLLSGAAVMVFSFASGAWTRSTYSYGEDLSRAATAWVAADEPLAPWNLLISIVTDCGTAFAAAATSGAIFGSFERYSASNTDGFYSVDSKGLGGPAVSLSGHVQTYGTGIFLYMFVIFIKSLVGLWTRYNTQWTAMEAGTHAIDMTLQVQRAFMLGVTHILCGGIAGKWFGPTIGYETRDLANLIMTQSIKGSVETTTTFNPYILYVVWAIIPRVLSVLVFVGLLWTIQVSRGHRDMLHMTPPWMHPLWPGYHQKL